MNKKLNKKLTFRQKLNKLVKLKADVDAIAKPLYEKWHDLEAEVIPEFIETINKKGEIVGLLTAPHQIRFKDGAVFELRPNYVSKEGVFKNAVFKMLAPEVFTIKQVEVDDHGKE